MKYKRYLVNGRQDMEYYDIRKSGKDLDLVITDKDYQNLAERYPEKRGKYFIVKYINGNL